MQQITSTEFKGRLGHYLASTREQPLLVEKSGQPVAVVLSPVEYEQMQEMEDLYWLARAEAAEQSGEWLNHQEVVRLLAAKLGKTE